jgi:hypothetical protein
MGDEIDLGEAGGRDVPPVRLEGDVVLQQRARLGPPVQPRRELTPVRGQPPIYLARADGQHLSLHGRPQPQRAQGSHRGSRALSRTDHG